MGAEEGATSRDRNALRAWMLTQHLLPCRAAAAVHTHGPSNRRQAPSHGCPCAQMLPHRRAQMLPQQQLQSSKARRVSSGPHQQPNSHSSRAVSVYRSSRASSWPACPSNSQQGHTPKYLPPANAQQPHHSATRTPPPRPQAATRPTSESGVGQHVGSRPP
jgi:hypothetical protein